MRSVRDYVIPVVDSIIYFIYIYISLVVGSYDSGTGGGGRRCCMYSWCGCGVVWCGLSLTTRGDGSGRGTVEWTMNESYIDFSIHPRVLRDGIRHFATYNNCSIVLYH